MTETAFICSDELWAGGFGDDHPLRPERLKMTYELLMAYQADFGSLPPSNPPLTFTLGKLSPA